MSIIKLLINKYYRYSYILKNINIENKEDILVKRLLHKLKIKTY
jgi:hypothetical protein